MRSDPQATRSSRWSAAHERTWEIVAVAGGAALVTLIVVLLSIQAERRINRVTLEAAPRPVTVEPARGVPYRDTRTYVGAVEPWIEANVGPQYVSAYVDAVLVRPGAVVQKGQVLATLDCSHPSAETRAVAMRARAVDAHMRAARDEAARTDEMLDGGFVAVNEAEQKTAASEEAHAELLETRADLTRASLDVSDCVLRAPFDGEIGTRGFDPGAFVRPGASIVSVVDRSTVRVVVDAPEKDFDALAPGRAARVEISATRAHVEAPISRRAPRADPKTRTIHFEVDLPNADRAYPVGTTALVEIAVGDPVPASEIPIYSATEESGKAKLFVVDRGVAHARTLPVMGEHDGKLYVTPSALAPGSLVVTEGRELLSDGDRVRADVETRTPDAGSEADAGDEGRGGGFGRPL